MKKKYLFSANRENILKMKVKLVFVALMLSLSFSYASNYSQGKMSVKLTNVKLLKVLDYIEDNSSYRFMYTKKEIALDSKMSISIENAGIKSVLDVVFKNTNISYSLLGNQIILNKIQKTTLRGTVYDAYDQPMFGVNVIINNSTGTTTDFDGNYEVIVKAGDIIEFSYLGYKSKKITYSGQETLNVILEEEAGMLDEVVISDGFKKVNRKQFTGVATRLKLEDIKQEGIADATRFLEGKDSGVVVDNVSGSFGASPRIRIRGNTSLNGNNNPIWVVDGVIIEDNVELDQGALASGDISSLIGSAIAGINPDDIKTFSILKDASATAMYGARAKNGVIVITTKRGTVGSMKVSYNTSFAFKTRPTYDNFSISNSQDELIVYAEEAGYKGRLDLANSQRSEAYGVVGKYYVGRRLGEVQGLANGYINDEYFYRYQKANTDWFDILFKDLSLQKNNSFSFSGGDKSATYFASVSALNDEGQTIGDYVNRYTARLNTRFKLNDKFSVGFLLSGSIREQRVPGTKNRTLDPIKGEYNRDFDINPYSYTLNSARSMTAYDENGDLEYFRKNFAAFNIIEELKNNYIDIDIADISFQTDFEYAFTDNLKLSSTANYRRVTTKREHIIGDDSNQANAFRADNGAVADVNSFLYTDLTDYTKDPYSILPEGGLNIYDEDELNYLYWRTALSWSYKPNENHEFSVLAGGEMKKSVRTNRNYQGIGISYENGSQVATHPDAIRQLLDNNNQYFEIGQTDQRFTGTFINMGYTLNEKYTFNGTVRRDGSNLQGKNPDSRYLLSYNISSSWNIEREDFIDIDWLNDLKFKATYGLSGGRGPSVSSARVLEGNIPVRQVDEYKETGIKLSSLENNDLTYEKLKEFSIGLEFAVNNNRISGELGYYVRNSFDLIGVVKTNGVGGEGYKYGNFADMGVEGYEFALNTLNIKTTNFSWSTSFNIGYNTEEVKKLENDPSYYSLIQSSGAPYTGREISALYSVRFAGLNQYGIPTFYNGDGEKVININLQENTNVAGVLKYEGPTQPRGSGGLTNTFKYKNFSLSANISFKFDYKLRIDASYSDYYNDYSSLPKDIINRWSLPGDETVTNIPAILSQSVATNVLGNNNAYNLYNKSDLLVADGTYARLKSIALDYKLPSKIAKSISITSAKFGVRADNILLLYSDSKLKGQDPEFFNSGGAALPMAKTITLSVNIVF